MNNTDHFEPAPLIDSPQLVESQELSLVEIAKREEFTCICSTDFWGA